MYLPPVRALNRTEDGKTLPAAHLTAVVLSVAQLPSVYSVVHVFCLLVSSSLVNMLLSLERFP